MTIYLVRHGLAMAGVEDPDPGLADLGHEQAQATADALRERHVVRLVVSPLRRTRETAIPIAQTLALEPEFRDEVAEVFDPRMEAGARRAMIGPFMAGRWSEQPEALRAWRQRAIDTLLELALAASAADGDLVVVSHYIAICAAIGEAMSDDRVVPVPLANCSITSIEVGHAGFTLLEAGATSHLEARLITGAGTATMGRQ